MAREFAGLEWEAVVGGEYNEFTATYGDHTLHIASDRDEIDWLYWIDDDMAVHGCRSLEHAARTVKELADENDDIDDLLRDEEGEED